MNTLAKSVNEFEFQILVKELEHADKQISSYMDLQMKILGVVFTLLAASLGILFSTKTGQTLTQENVSVVLGVISLLSSFGFLQTVINYGIALGYMYYKQCNIAPRLQRQIGLSDTPLQAITAFQQSPARLPVMIAMSVMSVCIFTLNAGILYYAWCNATGHILIKGFIIFAAVILLLTVLCQAFIGMAMKKIGIIHATEKND